MSIRPWAVSTTVAALLLVAGCDSMITPPPRDGSPPIQTDALSYELQPAQVVFEDGLGFELSLDYTNHTASPIHIENCLGELTVALVRSTQNGLEAIWRSENVGCASPDIVIMPGETLRRSFLVEGAPPGTNTFPQWEMSDRRGLARIVLGRVVSPSGAWLPLEERRSNAFALY